MMNRKPASKTPDRLCPTFATVIVLMMSLLLSACFSADTYTEMTRTAVAAHIAATVDARLALTWSAEATALQTYSPNQGTATALVRQATRQAAVAEAWGAATATADAVATTVAAQLAGTWPPLPTGTQDPFSMNDSATEIIRQATQQAAVDQTLVAMASQPALSSGEATATAFLRTATRQAVLAMTVVPTVTPTTDATQTPVSLPVPVELHLLVDENSLVLYVPVAGPVPLDELQLKAVTINGVETHAVRQDFASVLDLTNGLNPQAGACFRYYLAAASPVLPSVCSVQNTFSRSVVRAEVFWHDLIRGQGRDIAIYKGDQPVAVCPGTLPDCPFSYPVP